MQKQNHNLSKPTLLVKKFIFFSIFSLCFSFQIEAQGDNPINPSDSTHLEESNKPSLGERHIQEKGVFNPASAVEGKIVVKLCAKQNGDVIESSVEVDKEETTITDEKVIQQAIDAAKEWKFKPTDSKEIDCGVLTYNIKLEEE